MIVDLAARRRPARDRRATAPGAGARSGAVTSIRSGASSSSASARCSAASACSRTNARMRLIRIPSLRKPPSSRVLGRRHAGVVQRDDLPLVVEHRRAGGARLGVGRVVQEAVGDVDDPVLAQGDLLLLAARVLHDRHELADDRLALGLDQPVVAERRELSRRRGDRDEREVALLVGEEEAVGVEREDRGEPVPVDAVLEVELDHAGARGVRVGQHVVVRQQQGGGDERARAEAGAAGRPRRGCSRGPTARAAATPASR